MSKDNIIHVGVACWVFNPTGKVLIGQRLSPHGFGTWAPPGGKLEFGEMPTTCASRELWEETGIFIPKSHFHHIGFTRDVFPNCRYLTVHYLANIGHINPTVREPDKCKTWKWIDMRALPDNLFLPARNAIAQIVALRYMVASQIK